MCFKEKPLKIDVFRPAVRSPVWSPPTTPHGNHKSQHVIGNSMSCVAITIVIARFGRVRGIKLLPLVGQGRGEEKPPMRIAVRARSPCG